MAKSEPPTQHSTLAALPRGAVVTVVALPPAEARELLAHGVRPGARLAVEGDAPFGGPRIVRLGGSRVAIDRRLARAITVAGPLPADIAAGGRP